ncbi:MAG: hypothetical protein M3P04_02480 [Actinomycetota bacterium]|nr:hypothetical protein [Actinomycetota bacterium]
MSLLEWLRQLDEHVLRLFAPSDPATPRELHVGYVLAGVGLLAVVAAVLVAHHELTRSAMLAFGLLFLVPFLHDSLEAATARHR